MEISDVRRRVVEGIERARRQALDRRARADQAARDYQAFLDRTAVPLFKQVANVLRAEGFRFSVSTPGGSVRLTSDRSADDHVELLLETAGGEPTVVGRMRYNRGRNVIDSARPIGPPATVSEEEVLSFVLSALEQFVER
jgi:hypothetical protein